ncbi:UNVERIFIED_CONTAM: hypothetical protein FKN15_035920 [Acipenser sinensis]
MKFSGSFLYLVALALLVHGVPAAMGRRLHFGKCVVSVQVHELREYFSEIRKTIVGEDRNSGVRLLKEHAMMNIKHAHLHCQCDEETKKRIEAIQSTFEKVHRDCIFLYITLSVCMYLMHVKHKTLTTVLHFILYVDQCMHSSIHY